MNVSAWSIRNPIPAVLMFVMLTLLGLGIFALGVLATVASRRPTRSH